MITRLALLICVHDCSWPLGGSWVYSVAADSSGVYVSGLIAGDGVWFDNFTTSGSISSTARNTLVFKVSDKGSVVYVKNWNAADSW